MKNRSRKININNYNSRKLRDEVENLKNIDNPDGNGLTFSKKRKIDIIANDNGQNKRAKTDNTEIKPTLTPVEKRKATLKKKSQNSEEPLPLQSVETHLVFNYRHTQKGLCSQKNASSFGKTLKAEINGHINNKDIAFDTHLMLCYTKYTPSSPKKQTQLPRKIFAIRKGHDIVFDPIITENNTIRPARLNSSYTELATSADSMAGNIVSRGAFDNLFDARRRVARDIQRVGGGLPIRGNYTQNEWSDLSEFGGVIKIDKARAPKATKYIDEILADNTTSFSERFGGSKPIYKGTGKGTIRIGSYSVLRGAAALRALAKEPDNGDETDYGSDAEMMG